MTTKTGSGEISEYQGKVISPAIPYTFEYSVYDTLTEAKDSQDWPSDAEVLKWVNQSSERKSKANQYQKTLAPLREAYEATREFKVASIVSACVKAGMDRATAETFAESQVPK